MNLEEGKTYRHFHTGALYECLEVEDDSYAWFLNEKGEEVKVHKAVLEELNLSYNNKEVFKLGTIIEKEEEEKTPLAYETYNFKFKEEHINVSETTKKALLIGLI